MSDELDYLFEAVDSIDGRPTIAPLINCSLGVQWIWDIFGECVETRANFAGFVLGFVSLALWLLPLFPQLYENYRRRNCDGLSIYFLLFWFFGDATNFVGAILTQQLPIQVIIGVYYLVQDSLLFVQYFYYNVFAFGRRISSRRSSEASARQLLSCCLIFCFLGSFSYEGGEPTGGDVSRFASRKLQRQLFHNTSDVIGYAFGCLSAASYFCGRIPQLIKNCRRQSTEGVSIAMFVIIVFANLTYGTSVLLAGQGSRYIVRHLPWLLGSFGCCLLDTLVISQFFCYYTGDAYADVLTDDELSSSEDDDEQEERDRPIASS